MPHAYTCSACVAAKVQRPAISYSRDDLLDAPKDAWTCWHTDASPGWICTDCWCTREPEELEALVGQPVEVLAYPQRTIVSPKTPPERVELRGSNSAYYP